MTTQQSLRLALSYIRPDDFNTVKAISELDLEAIASHFQPKGYAQSGRILSIRVLYYQ
ncbi:hypothetical protein [Nostoc sp.]|uniref:hypothetical protein n=1 Tax=Nostoc sp. TaxID=1180 RepID=UPI002FFA959C